MLSTALALTLAAAPAPATPAVPSAPAKPLAPPWVEEPATVADADRAKLMLFEDGKGRLVASGPYEAHLAFAGDEKKLFKLSLQTEGGADNEGFDWTFWEPRAEAWWQRSFEVRIPEGTAKLHCGEAAIPFKRVPDARARKILSKAALLEARWRRAPQVLGRSDEGEYFFVDAAAAGDVNFVEAARAAAYLSVDAARTVAGDEAKKRDFRLYVGRTGSLVRVEVVDVIEDGAGMLFVTAGGRLEARWTEDRELYLAWITAAGRKELELVWDGPLVYGDLGVYAGESLGTPCDGRL